MHICNHKLQIYNVFDRYFYLTCVAISKKHLQPYIWVVPSLFQGATRSDLGYCVSLKQALAVIPFFKANLQFHYSHPCADRYLYIIKQQLQPCILSNLLCACRAGITIARNWFQACISWKKSVIWWHHFQPSICSMIWSLFHGSTWSDPYVKDTVFISQHLLQQSIITSGLWLIREKLKGMFFWGKPL